jgi:hypothetical protein
VTVTGASRALPKLPAAPVVLDPATSQEPFP